MSKPDDIPMDVFSAAEAHTTIHLNPSRGAIFVHTVHIVARAIMAERARCLTIAKSQRGASAEIIAEQIANGTVKERI